MVTITFKLDRLGIGFTPPSTKQYKAQLNSNMSVQFSAVAVHSYKFSTKQNSFCILNFLQCSTVTRIRYIVSTVQNSIDICFVLH